MTMTIKIHETTRRQKAQQAIRGKQSNIYTVTIMTAENPHGIKYSDTENVKLNQSLVEYLKKRSYRYFPIKGKYNDPEHSFMIYNMRLSDTKDLVKEYGQESFIFVQKLTDVVSYEYWEENNKGEYTQKAEQSFIEDATDDSNMFSQISRKFKFRIPFDAAEASASASEYNEFLESRKNDPNSRYFDGANWDVHDDILKSLEETRTWKSCYMHRMAANCG